MPLDIEPILELAKISPTGLPDNNALQKLLAEREEYTQAKRKSERLEEKVDQLYYLIKEIFNLGDEEFTLEQLFLACQAKYFLRFILHDKLKDKIAERERMMKVLGLTED